MSQPYYSSDASPAERRLIRVLESDAPDSTGMSDQVREAICDFVRELKTQGLAPERVLVSVKTVIAAASATRDTEEQRRFLQQAISWCIEEYYDGK